MTERHFKGIKRRVLVGFVLALFLLIGSSTSLSASNLQPQIVSQCVVPSLQLLDSSQIGAQSLPDLTFQAFGPTQGIYHVAPPPLGSNGNPGTEQQPWATIKYAAGQLRAGQTAIVHAGIYTETDITTANAGQQGKPVRLIAAPGER